jgi:hypothetical protein
MRSDLPSLQPVPELESAVPAVPAGAMFRLAKSNGLFIHIPRCLGSLGVKKNQYQLLNRNSQGMLQTFAETLRTNLLSPGHGSQFPIVCPGSCVPATDRMITATIAHPGGPVSEDTVAMSHIPRTTSLTLHQRTAKRSGFSLIWQFP